MTRRRPTAVRISGPLTCRVTDPPPRFVVEAGRAVLFMVELAAARHLMTSIADRTLDNYHYGGDLDGGFAVGKEWSMPQEVWGRLCRLPLLFYRVVAFDQVAGESTLSVDDRDLHLLPVLRLQPLGRRPVTSGAGQDEPSVSSR